MILEMSSDYLSICDFSSSKEDEKSLMECDLRKRDCYKGERKYILVTQTYIKIIAVTERDFQI